MKVLHIYSESKSETFISHKVKVYVKELTQPKMAGADLEKSDFRLKSRKVKIGK